MLLLWLTPVLVAAQQPRLATGYWTRGVAGGWGHAWKHGLPGYGKTASDVDFAAFHPQLGRFVTDHLEIYGEGTVLVYRQPVREVGAGLAGLGGRYHVWRDRSWTPYVVGIAGLLWTSLDVPEIDRVFKFPARVRPRRPRGPAAGTGAAGGAAQPPYLQRGYGRRESGPERGDRDRRRPMGSALSRRAVELAAPPCREVSFGP